jgi:predicted anti-sigma-YlaC factor YlaD
MMTETTCDWTVERLPWWVNGTLEEAEAQRVEAHLAECAACRDELAATRGALALYGAHLPIEALLELVERETGDGEAGERETGGSGRAAGGPEPSREAVLSSEAVAAHLGHCPACREQLALLRDPIAIVGCRDKKPRNSIDRS